MFTRPSARYKHGWENSKTQKNVNRFVSQNKTHFVTLFANSLFFAPLIFVFVLFLFLYIFHFLFLRFEKSCFFHFSCSLLVVFFSFSNQICKFIIFISCQKFSNSNNNSFLLEK